MLRMSSNVECLYAQNRFVLITPYDFNTVIIKNAHVTRAIAVSDSYPHHCAL